MGWQGRKEAGKLQRRTAEAEKQVPSARSLGHPPNAKASAGSKPNHNKRGSAKWLVGQSLRHVCPCVAACCDAIVSLQLRYHPMRSFGWPLVQLKDVDWRVGRSPKMSTLWSFGCLLVLAGSLFSPLLFFALKTHGSQVPGPKDSVIVATDATAVDNMWLEMDMSAQVDSLTIQPSPLPGNRFMYST